MCCSKTHPCGHLCGGIADESRCLPCLHGCKNGSEDGASELRQDADDMCMICFTEALSAAPAIQVRGWCRLCSERPHNMYTYMQVHTRAHTFASPQCTHILHHVSADMWSRVSSPLLFECSQEAVVRAQNHIWFLTVSHMQGAC